MAAESIIIMSKLKCNSEKTNPSLFFNLVYYRNDLFTSSDSNKILEFYNSLENRDQLIQWMRKILKGASRIHEAKGDRDIIVVMPTLDFNEKYVMKCRENIFKGLHIVFVESGGENDFYFNLAHNCIVGPKRTMEYSPKWFVVSNYDMYKVDVESVRKNKTSKVDSKNPLMIFYNPSPSRSYWKVVGIKREKISIFILSIYYCINSQIKQYKIDNIGILMLRKKLNNQIEKFVGDD